MPGGLSSWLGILPVHSMLSDWRLQAGVRAAGCYPRVFGGADSFHF
jgi:hypothetical protein